MFFTLKIVQYLITKLFGKKLHWKHLFLKKRLKLFLKINFLVIKHILKNLKRYIWHTLKFITNGDPLIFVCMVNETVCYDLVFDMM